jgi:methylamine dehydrogenase accessory protein MauD
MILLTIATAIQFLILIGLALVVLSLARQVGILHERLSPAGMTRSKREVEPGQLVPMTTIPALSGASVELTGQNTALLFVSAECPICKTVLPAFEDALPGTGYEPLWVADGLPGPSGEMPDYGRFAQDQLVDEDRMLVSQELGLSLGVRQIPALVLIGADGRLIARETLSGPRQVAALLSANPAAQPA